MPRKKINIPEKLEYLSILDEKGKLDEKLEPDIPKDLLLKLHRAMVLARRFDERLLSLQRQGRLGTFAPIKGQEASQLGAVAALEETDWMVPAFRETGAELWRGRTLVSVLLGFGGFSEGDPEEKEHNDLPVAVPVSSQIPHAVGLAWSIKYRQKKDVVMTFFGDGGTSEGDFHEALNFAGVYQIPVVFVCQNNQWAISVPRSKQTRAKTLAQKALAYGMPGLQVDGNDILAVYASAREAVDRARSGKGPMMVECETYRMMMHTTADDPKRYRTDEEVRSWERKDPLVRFQQYLQGKNLLTDDNIGQIEEEVKNEIQQAVDRAEKLMKEFTDPLIIFDHVLADMPPSLLEQRQELSEEIRVSEEEGANE
jgi:pyruvate dehydrogenase E1 component alpha subunit